jgi:hypothetical protein
MQRKFAVILITLLFALTASPTHAGFGYITVTDGSTNRCTINTAGGTFSVVVMVLASVPVTDIHVQTSPPPCLNAILLSEGPVGGLLPIGADIRTGMDFPLGGCTDAPIALYQFDYIALGTTGDCCTWEIELAASTDCYGATTGMTRLKHPINRTAACTCSVPAGNCTFDCDDPLLIPPHSPSPAAGATAVALDAQLSFVVPDAPIGELAIYFGPATSPSNVYAGPVISTFDPGPLQPNTEYRWFIIVPTEPEDPSPLISPDWTFTTEGTVPANRVSWGAIKALYD